MSFSDEVGLTIETGNREVAFNHRNYIEAYKAKTVRLHLRSKRNDADCEPFYADCSVFGQQLTLVSMRTYACFCNHVLDSH